MGGVVKMVLAQALAHLRAGFRRAEQHRAEHGHLRIKAVGENAVENERRSRFGFPEGLGPSRTMAPRGAGPSTLAGAFRCERVYRSHIAVPTNSCGYFFLSAFGVFLPAFSSVPVDFADGAPPPSGPTTQIFTLVTTSACNFTSTS